MKDIFKELQVTIVDYPTGCKLVPPSSHFDTFEEWQAAIKAAPWYLPPEDCGARIHDLKTERKKRDKKNEGYDNWHDKPNRK